MVRWIVAFLVIVAALLACWYGASEASISWSQIVEQEQALRDAIQRHPLVSLCLGYFLYVLVSLIPGTSGKAILVGWLFGFWSGLAIVCSALTTTAVISFLLARYLLFGIVQRRFSFVVRFIHQAFERRGSLYLVTLRLLHVPFSLVNYAAGVTEVPTRTFVWTTLVGMLPGNLVFVLAGSQLPSLEGVSEKGVWSLIDLRVLAALTMAVLIPMLLPRLVRALRSPEARRERRVDTERLQAKGDKPSGSFRELDRENDNPQDDSIRDAKGKRRSC